MNPMLRMSFDYTNMDLRASILYKSLNFEKAISNFIAKLLSIDDHKKTYSFGYTSKALSFNQKVYLLIDIEALDKKTISKYVKFMEIRNKFMHNIDIKSFEDCCMYTEGLKEYLLKNYPSQDSRDIEKNLSNSFELLNKDLIDITHGLYDKLMSKMNSESKIKLNEVLVKSYNTNMIMIKDQLNVMMSDFAKGNPQVDLAKFENLGTNIFDFLTEKIYQDLKKSQ